jgi:hypothetical protein
LVLTTKKGRGVDDETGTIGKGPNGVSDCDDRSKIGQIPETFGDALELVSTQIEILQIRQRKDFLGNFLQAALRQYYPR